jgi:iron complex transport system substrate-binding protein
VTAARFDPAQLSSTEIDRAVREALRGGRSLYAVDAGVIDELAPDLIVTQDLCAVCAVSEHELRTACPIDVEVISLDPRTYGEVADSVRKLAARLGVPERGDAIAAQMTSARDQTACAVRDLPVRRVFFAEWIDPPFCAGHWLPEMIAAGGGIDILGRAGAPSFPTTWDAVLEHAPELVILGPCGFGIEEAAERAAGLDLPVPAIVVDGDAHYSRPGPRLADGVRQLAHLLHPDAVADPGLPAVQLRQPPVAASAMSARIAFTSMPTPMNGIDGFHST